MRDPMIVATPKGTARIGRPEGWITLGWIGLVFAIVGGVDFALTWYPTHFGNREWQFATVTQSFNGLPILLLGLAFLTVGSRETDRRWWGIAGVTGAAVMLVWVLAGFVLWALQVPLAVRTVPEGLAAGLLKAIVKTFLQSFAYAAILGYLIRKGWQAKKATLPAA